MASSLRKEMERCLNILDRQLDHEIRQARDRDSARFLYGQIVGALALGRTLGIINDEEEELRFLEVQRKFYDAF